MTTVRPTRRGWAVAGIAATGVALAAVAGPRSLGAVVVPAVVALAAGVMQAWLAPTPRVERVRPPDGPAGREATVRLRFDVDDPFPARVRDRLPGGVVALDPGPVETVVGEAETCYRVRFDRRGRWRLGPTEVRSTDVLGLVARRATVGDASPVLVYPPVRRLPPELTARLRAGLAGAARDGRDEFDGLREYVRGDALRDLNWKASAKRDDLVVTEYAGSRPDRTVTVAAGSDRAGADAMATTAASLVVALIDLGVTVDLRTPDGTVSARPGERDRALVHLATVGPGAVPDGEATVTVEARDGAVGVRVDGEETRLDDREVAA